MFRIVTIAAFLVGLSPFIAEPAEPLLWLDAGNAESMTQQDGRVVRWRGIGGQAGSFDQATPEAQPQIGESLNGRSTVYFDGNDFLEGNAVLAGGDDTFTFIALWRPRRIAIQAVFEQAGTGTGRRASLLQVQGAYGFNGQGNDFHSAVPLQPNQWRLTAMILTGAARNNVVLVDNGSPPVVGTVNIDVQNVGTDKAVLGRKIYGSEFLQGDIAEVRIYGDAISGTELIAELDAVKKRWKLDFKSLAPTVKVVEASGVTTAEGAEKLAMTFKATPEHLEFFENRVRPLLVEHCYECHSGASEKLQGGLRVDARLLAVRGGDTGPGLIPGKPVESLLIDAVKWKSYEMPPNGKLKPAEIATLERWVELGAPWPDEAVPALAAKNVSGSGYDWNKWRTEHWAFQPVTKPQPPQISADARIQNDIDRFVVARQAAAGLKQSPAAEPRILARRLYFNLIGLPPTPEQVEQFVNDYKSERNAAIVSLIDRLLDSPQYGERWGRYWLDVARYSDQDTGDFSQAWRYRDWVVNALNQDMPFDHFVRLQIAGDLIGDRNDAVATGFFALGPTYNSDGGDPDGVAAAKSETLSDRLDTLGRGLLGLTLACARCHDHKFDPLPQQDYYSLAGVFNNSARHELPLTDPEVVDSYKKGQQTIRQLDERIKNRQKEVNDKNESATAEEKAELEQWKAELADLRKTAPTKYDFAHTLRDAGNGDMKVAVRGNLRKPGEPAPRRFLRILAGDDAALFAAGSGRRELAEAIADPKNPLTSRVFVNRVWLHHFGKSLVRTPSNFGSLGEQPTHPELLDWLTASFIESGQSLKSLHRLILVSATWQMSSQFDEASYQIDGDNRWIWRMNPRRLEAEALRDSLLQVTGELDLSLGGPATDQVASPRRTLYFKVSRDGDDFRTDEFLRLFDFPLMRATVDKRPTSIVPQQFLFLLNSPFMLDRAKTLTRRVHNEASTDEERIQRLCQLLYQRPARQEEIEIGLAFLTQGGQSEQGLSVWEQYAQVLSGANEFMYVR